MERTYERDLSHNYMILREEVPSYQEDYQLYMLAENKIPGLLECRFKSLNGRLQLDYEITSRQPLGIAYERKPMGYEELRRMLEDLQSLMEEMKKYLLDPNHLILEPEYMYVNVDTARLSLCYCPFYEQNIRQAFYNFSEYLLGKLHKQDKEAIAMGYELYKLAGEENSSVEEILKRYERRQEPAMSESKPAPPEIISKETAPEPEDDLEELLWLPEEKTEEVLEEEPSFLHFLMQKLPFFSEKKKDRTEKTKKKKERKKQEPEPVLTAGPEVLPLEADDFPKEEPDTRTEEAEDLLYGETTLLSGALADQLLLVSASDQYEDFFITSQDFFIGKKREAVDGWIGSKTVSRIHARIQKEGAQYQLYDLNSTNGTYINDIPLLPGQGALLQKKDRIRFAEIEYLVG